MNETFTYDDVPYPSYTFPQTHPDRLGAAARLYGVAAADPAGCSVLELGCGDGTNLLSQAYSLPGSRFLGVDLSRVHIDDANRSASELGLTNITFEAADVSEIDTDKLGKFDYVIAHGLFSWVPEAVRLHILRVYSDCLADQGVGYISYNAYPGCHLREITNGIMRYQADRMEGYEQKVKYGEAYLKFVADAAEEDSLYQRMLRLELGQIAERSVENVFHDDLSPMNQPLYFHEFNSMIQEHEMQFLIESDLAASNPARLSKNGRKLLEKFNDDLIGREQLLDMIICRRFRSTLICREGVEISREGNADRLDGLFITSGMKAGQTEPDVSGDSPLRFTGKGDASVELNHPLTKAALLHLERISPGNCTIRELLDEASRMAGKGNSTADDRSRATEFIWQIYCAAFVRLGLTRYEFAITPAVRPRSSDLARHQVGRGSETVMTLTGSNLEVLDTMTRLLIYLSDGSRDRQALAADIAANLDLDGPQKDDLMSALPERIEHGLDELAQAGLLVK